MIMGPEERCWDEIFGKCGRDYIEVPPDGKEDTYPYRIRQVHVEDTRFWLYVI
jgi:hypothetical protein